MSNNRFYKLFNRGRNFSLNKKLPERINGEQYYYITNFDHVDEKKCLDYDKKNDHIYQNNIKIYNELSEKLSNTPFNIDKKPSPPLRPNNYERYYLWKQRNIKINAYEQSVSILYLLASNINIKFSDYENGVEPFEATKIAEELANERNENMMNVVYQYLSVLNLNNDIHHKYRNQVNNKLECSNPEHHSVKDKVVHFNEQHFNDNHHNNNTDYTKPSAPPYYPELNTETNTDTFKSVNN
jgi:hypothetical protein